MEHSRAIKILSQFVSKQNLNKFPPSFVLEGKLVIDGQLMVLVQSQHPQTKKK